MENSKFDKINEFDEFDEYEPPKKIMKYENENDNINRYGNRCKTEIELVQFKIGYVTKKGDILLEKNNEDSKHSEHSEHSEDSEDNNILLSDSNNKPFKVYIMNFQTFEGGEAYLIANTNDTITNIDINKGYTINEIFNNFMKGNYFIGILHYYYKDNYKNGIITDITTFDDDSNDEIRLHYTKNKKYYGNVAWRSMNWDLFEDFVPKD